MLREEHTASSQCGATPSEREHTPCLVPAMVAFSWRSGDRCAEKRSRNHKLCTTRAWISEVNYPGMSPLSPISFVTNLAKARPALGRRRSMDSASFPFSNSQHAYTPAKQEVSHFTISWFHLYLVNSWTNSSLYRRDRFFAGSYCALVALTRCATRLFLMFSGCPFDGPQPFLFVRVSLPHIRASASRTVFELGSLTR